MENTNIPPNKIMFEITEGSTIHDNEMSGHVIDSLRDIGIKISLDDFGAGYSSLKTLRKLNLDLLKIDRSLIMNVPGNAEDSAIVAGLITIAHSMNLKVIAEGVEAEDQITFLESNGCDMAQGYLFSVPVLEDKMKEILKKQFII